MALIPGAEVNIREGAHVIVLGEIAELRRLDEAFPSGCPSTYEPTLREFLDVTDDFDVVRIGAHMFRRAKELGKFAAGDLRRLHALEINGKDFGTEVMLLVQARALGLPIVGGSDAHHWLQIGVRHTLVHTDDISLHNLIKTIKEGLTGFATAPYTPLRVKAAKSLKNITKVSTEMLRRGGAAGSLAGRLDDRPSLTPPRPAPRRASARRAGDRRDPGEVSRTRAPGRRGVLPLPARQGRAGRRDGGGNGRALRRRLATAEFVILEIEVKQKKRANHVTIKLRWPKRPLIRPGVVERGFMGDKQEFEFEGSASPAEAADALNRIAEGIRARSLSLSMGEDEITVFPAGDLSMEIEASEKKGKAKIEIAIAWKHAKATTTSSGRRVGMGKDHFEFARMASPEEVAEYLSSLAVGLKRGEVSLESGERALRLIPAAVSSSRSRCARRSRRGRSRSSSAGSVRTAHGPATCASPSVLDRPRPCRGRRRAAPDVP